MEKMEKTRHVNTFSVFVHNFDPDFFEDTVVTGDGS
jgi:hypothetical protein